MRPGLLGLSLHPLRQPAPIFFQQKCSHPKAFADNAVRLRIARGAR